MNEEERKQIEDEIWSNYNSDMYSELKKYGKRFIAVAAIVCLALCIGVHHSTQAKADKYYKKKIKAKDRQIKVLKEYKENAKEAAAANYYQCTKEVSGIIIGDGYGSNVKLQKGEIVREVSQNEDRELVIYTQMGYGDIKVQFNRNKFDKCFTDIDVPIG